MKTVNNYLKNVIKSVSYAAVDVSGDYLKSVNEFTSTNKEFATATYSALKNPAAFVRRSVEAIQDSKVYKALDYGIRNAAEDLRTGNFYNKERKDRDELALSGLDADGFNDLSEFGIDDNWEDSIGKSPSKNDEISAGDVKIVQSIEGSNAALASATVNAVISSSNNQIKNSRINTGVLYEQNERLFGGLHKDISVIGNTMTQMHKIQHESLQNIDKNLSEFFTNESKLSAERNAILKEMLEMQRNMYKTADEKQKEANSKKKSSRVRWNDINVNGVVNLDAYFGAVKKNFANQLSTIMPASFSEDGNMLATFMTSPWEFAVKGLVDGIIPATVKAAAKELDGTISGVFGNIIGELGNARSKNDGGLLGTIAKFFGISTSVNRSIDTSRYEKGPVPFDGLTRKAIIDVIPTYLRRIEASITGRPEETYDYKAGKWIKVSSVRKQFEDIKKNSITRATSDVREAMNPGIQTVRRGIDNEKTRDDFDKAVEQFWQYLYENNGRFNPNASAEKNGINSFTYRELYQNYNTIRTIFRNFGTIETKDKKTGKTVTRNTRNSIRMNIPMNVMDAKDAEERFYREAELDPSSVFNTIFGLDSKNDSHGKMVNGKFEAYNVLKDTKDKLGNTIFDYLQNINTELSWFRINGIPGHMTGADSTTSNTRQSFDDIKKGLSQVKNSTTSDYDKQKARNEQIARSALSAISSGKAVDFRYLSTDEQSYLLGLSERIRNNSVEQYRDEVKGYNEGEIAKWMDKHVYKTNIKSMKDVEDAMKKADKEGKNTNEVMDVKEETFLKKIFNRISDGGSILGGIAGASAEAFTNVLYAADKAIYEMMYKTEIDDDETKKKYNGFMDAMVGKITDKFKDIGDMFMKNVVEPFKERLGIDKDFTDRFKDSLINTGSKLWTSFKDANLSVYGPVIDKVGEHTDSIKNKIEKKQISKNLKEKYSNVYKKKRKGLTSEYEKTDDESVILERLKTIGVKSSEIDKIRAKFTDKDGKLDEKSYIDELNKLYKSNRSKPVWERLESSDALATKRQRDLRYKAAVGDSSDLLNWGKRNHFYSDDEHELEDRLISAGLVSRHKLDNIRNHSYKDGKFDLDIYRAALTKMYNRYLTKNHARGTTGRPFTGLTTLTKGEGLITGSGFGTVPKTGVYNITTPTHIINTEDMHDSGLGSGPRKSVRKALGEERLAAKRAGFNIAHHDKGTLKISNNKELSTDEFLEEAKKFIPEAASGGLIGGILSLLLGTIGGPLVGAAIGAGGSIIASSDTIKEKLFGKVGKDGKREGNIVSKSILNTFSKYFPDMAKYGLAGIIPGLITPLGPIGGLMAGAAFGFLKNNERFTTKYFGEEGKLSIKSKEKKIIEDMLPGALKGAGVGAITSLLFGGPFGLVGNAALGSALGMMASTEEFKEGILGKEINGVRVGGLINEIRDVFSPLKDSMKDLGSKLIEVFDNNIIDPIARFITPAIHAIPQVASIIPRKINEFFTSKKFGRNIGQFFRDYVTDPIVGVVKNVMTPITKTLMGVVTSPVKLLGWAGDKIRQRQIATNNADYMTARERMDFLAKRGKDGKISDMDKILADIGTKDGLSVDKAKELNDALSSIHDTKTELQANKHSQERKINKILDNYTTPDGGKLSKKAKAKLREALESGDMELFKKILTNYRLTGSNKGLSQEEVNSLLDGELNLGKEVKDYFNIRDRFSKAGEKTVDDLTDEQRELLKRLGLKDGDLTNKHEMRKLMANLQTEIYDREANKTGKGEETLNPELSKGMDKIIEEVTDISKNVRAIATNSTDEMKALREQRDAEYNKTKEDIQKTFDKRKERNATLIDKDKYDKFSEEVKDSLSANSKSGMPTGIIPTRKKANKANDNRERIIKYDFDIDTINASGGNLQRVEFFTKRKYKLEPEAIKYVNKLTETDFQSIVKYFNNKNIKALLTRRPVTVEDIKYGIGLSKRQRKQIDNKFDYVFGALGRNIKDYDTVEQVFNDVGYHSPKAQVVTPTTEEQPAQEVETNALGTIIGGAARIIGSGIKNVGVWGAKKVGAWATKKVKQRKEEKTNKTEEAVASVLKSEDNKPTTAPVVAPTSDHEHVGDGKFVKTVVKEDGSKEPDTADAKTKEVINELTFKDKLKQEALNAQIRMSELIENNFDTSDITESKGGKFGWIKTLLIGGYLWKSGILGKLFNGFIKPLWTDHIKPWTTNVAWPWVKGIWTDNIKPWITDTAVPWLRDTALPAVGNVLTTAVTGAIELLIKKLPDIIVAAVKGALGIGDAITGNENNVGVKNVVDSKDLVNSKGSDYVTGLRDENGKTLTAGDIANGNYNKIYNSEGVEGAVDKNGKITFKDASGVGTSYLQKIGSTAKNAFATAAFRGNSSLGIKALDSVGNLLHNSKGPFKKILGSGVNMISKPLKAVEAKSANVRTTGFAGKLVDSVVEKMLEKDGLKAGTEAFDIAKTLLDGTDGSKFANKFKKVVDFTDDGIIGSITKKAGKFNATMKENLLKEGAENVAKEAGEKVVKEGAEKVAEAAAKNGGFLSRILEAGKKLINSLFNNPTVTKKLNEVAKALGNTKAGGFIKSFKEGIEKIVNEALEKGIKKVGAETCKKVLSKVFAVVFLVTDFLTGCDQAESILGVKETTIIEEVTAGLINAISNFLIIPSIFPGTNWLARKIYGLFDKNLEERQNEATADYEEWKKEHGSTLTKEEYLKRQKSLTGKVGGWFSDGFNKAKTGIKNLFKKEKSVDVNAPVNQTGISMLTANATGTVSLSGNKYTPTGGFLTSLFGEFGDLATQFSGGLNLKNVFNTISKATTGKISVFDKNYWNDSDVPKAKGLFGTVLNFAGYLAKAMKFPTLTIMELMQGAVSDIVDIGSATTGVTSSTFKTSTSTTGKTSIGSKIKNLFSSAVSSIKNFFGAGTGDYKYGTGGYSKQIDPSITNIRFNSSSDSDYQTIGDSGCGPAAAVNAIESMYGRGGSAVINAAKLAIKGGYKETDGGTKPGFFTDYFNRHGLGSQTSYNKSEIAKNIINGRPTVIMGRNPKGVSSSSPFGKNPHYVTVTGMDGKGNAIVQDPESRYDNQLYPLNSLMKNTSLGVSAFGRGKWGRGNYDANIWWYLKQMGMTDAGAAGMMGNIEAESGLQFNNVENLLERRLNGKYNDETYTAAVDSGEISKEKFLHPMGGNSQYGYGLVQWTSPNRKEGLYNLAKSRKVSISDPVTQLDWLKAELTTSYKNVLKVLTSTNSLLEASNIVLGKFEKPANWQNKSAARAIKGEKYLNKYGGTSGEKLNISTSSINDPVGGIAETLTNKSTTTGNNATDIFSLASNALLGKLNNTGISEALSLFTNAFTSEASKLLAIDSDVDAETDTGYSSSISSNNNTTSNASGYANRIVDIAKQELKYGVKENPLGSNNVKYNDWYWGSNRKEPWCGAFVSWVANQAGVPTSIIPKYAYTPTGYNILKANGGEVPKTEAKAGDILFTYSKSKGRIGHTGIVTGRRGKDVVSIEGNYSNRVSEVVRSPGDGDYENMYITRPKYGTGTNKPISKYGQFKDYINGNGMKSNYNRSSNTGIIKSNISSKSSLTNQKPIIFGAGTSPDYSKLINAIINILMTIADNTDKLNMIVSILNNKLGTTLSASDVSNATTDKQSLKSKLSNALNGINSSTSKFNTYADSIGDSSINAIITAMNAIASE